MQISCAGTRQQVFRCFDRIGNSAEKRFRRCRFHADKSSFPKILQVCRAVSMSLGIGRWRQWRTAARRAAASPGRMKLVKMYICGIRTHSCLETKLCRPNANFGSKTFLGAALSATRGGGDALQGNVLLNLGTDRENRADFPGWPERICDRNPYRTGPVARPMRFERPTGLQPIPFRRIASV